MHYLYILYSDSLDKYYTGQSHDPHGRLAHHNSTQNTIWTKRGQPWITVGLFELPTKKEAVSAERFIKKQKSSKTILKILREGFHFNGSILPNKVAKNAG